MLGGSKGQLAVWHGQQMTSLFCDTVKIRNVFLYPTEYITNGIGWNGVHEDITPIITRPDGSKEYRISDHLASLRVSLTNGSPTKYYDYDPWGSLLSGTPTRRMFNDREEDKENSLYNNGVRKLDDGLGRFTAIDPLWEKFRWQSPYVYDDNNPLGKTDPDGMQGRQVQRVQTQASAPTGSVEAAGQNLYNGGSGGDLGWEVLFNAIGDALSGDNTPTPAPTPTPSPTAQTTVQQAGTNAATQAVTVTNEEQFRVRRFVSKAEMKDMKKNGIVFDPQKGNGIPTITINFTPKNQDHAKRATGAASAEYMIDLNVTGVPRGADKKTKSGLPEYTLQGSVPADRILQIQRVNK